MWQQVQRHVREASRPLASRHRLRIISGLRPGAMIAGTNRRSLHADGLAVDLAGSRKDMLAAAREARELPLVREIIHDGRVWTSRRGDRAHSGNPHRGHVHIGFWPSERVAYLVTVPSSMANRDEVRSRMVRATGFRWHDGPDGTLVTGASQRTLAMIRRTSPYRVIVTRLDKTAS